MEMREHVRFSDATGPVADRTAVKNRWKWQAEGAMAEVRLVRVKARRLLCVVTHFFSVLNCQDDKNSPRAHPGPVLG
jgi:hypothetical protein